MSTRVQPRSPLGKFAYKAESVLLYSFQAALTFPSANTRSSARADMLKSGKQLSNMNDGTGLFYSGQCRTNLFICLESIRSGFLDETRNEVS